jgi:carbamoyltransferase
MKIVGAWSGHDCSFCVLENGKPLVHAEYERYNREKSPSGDALQFLFDRKPDLADESVHFISVHPKKKIRQHTQSHNRAMVIAEKNGGDFHFISHHKAHAAHAFYSSNFEDALILTLDGGGVEDDRGGESACTIWEGQDKSLSHLQTFRPHEINIGGVWTRITRYIFKLNNGWPLGSQEGTVMAMAAMGDPGRYHTDFYKMLTADILSAGFKPPNQPPGPTSDKDPKHPYLEPWAAIARRSEQDKFDLAAGLQSATELLIKQFIGYALTKSTSRKICIAGGVVLNSVAMGKIWNWYPQIEAVYIPPVPYDGGLSLGAAQWLWHDKLQNDRVDWNVNFSPYLGEIWPEQDVLDSVSEAVSTGRVISKKAKISDVIDLLQEGDIVSVYNEESESGRRALGNRSILADPRKNYMKERVNEKVKHRQWFRPFAPSILRHRVAEWFERDVDSPYMQYVVNFKQDMGARVPAVNHLDGTARLQTVCREDNEWYFNFLTEWELCTGVPIILNTSFNDREPICETPRHSVDCFMKTNIDHLYFVREEILLSKKIQDV